MRKIGKLYPFLFFIFLITAPPLLWSQVKVEGLVDRNQVAEGETFTFMISVSSSSSVNIADPETPQFKDFEYLNSWSSSQTSSTYTNGQFQVERVKTFNYMLTPKKKGNLTLGSMSIEVDGKTYKTKPINIRVLAGGTNPSPNRQQARPRKRPSPFDTKDPFEDMDDIFSQLLRRGGRPGFQSQIRNPKEAFFIRVEVDKTKVYVGEQLTVSWYLYTKGHITEIDTLKYPSLNGFWKEDIEVATRLNFTQEVVNGEAYQKALLASYALFPIKKGKAVIDSYKAKCRVVAGGFGFGRSYQYTKASDPVKVEVLPIPVEGRPQDFSGAVGQFDVLAELVPSKNHDYVYKTNEPLTYKIRFEGRGNAKRIDLPAMEWPDGFEFYDTKKDSKFFKTGESYKEFELLLIPRKPGEVQLPAMSVSLFDPETEQFYQKKIPAQKVSIIPGEGSDFTPDAVPLQTQTEANSNPKKVVPPIFTEWVESQSFKSEYQAYMWGGAFSISILFLLWRAFFELGWGLKQKSLFEEVQKKVQRAKRSRDVADWREVGVELTNALYLALGHVSSLGAANVQLEKLIKKLPPSVRRENSEKILKLSQKLEVLSFAPEGVVGKLKEREQLNQVIKESEDLLKVILQGSE